MKCYTVTIRPAGAAEYSFTGLYSDSFSAISHALEITGGHPCRISAKVKT